MTEANSRALKMSLLTGGDSAHYMFPLSDALASKGVEVDFIGSDYMATFEAAGTAGVNFLNLRGDQSEDAPKREKLLRITRYYWRLMAYSARTDSPIFHIQWMNRFVHFDRTLLNVFYKMTGKKLVFTAHNINDGERDQTDSFINRLTLKFMYGIMDHIIVHTRLMKTQLVENYGIDEKRVTVIPIGLYNTNPYTDLSKGAARKRLGLQDSEKVILFFGLIASYKGLDVLVRAMRDVVASIPDVKLLVAGKIKSGNEAYWNDVQKSIRDYGLEDWIVQRIEFIPDEDLEMYFKGSDVVILPYRNIFQTGVMFVAYHYGLPAIVSDVGSLSEYVIEGETGYVCRPEDPADLAEKICTFFQSDLYRNLDAKRGEIRRFTAEKYSWEKIADKTSAIYENLLAGA